MKRRSRRYHRGRVQTCFELLVTLSTFLVCDSADDLAGALPSGYICCGCESDVGATPSRGVSSPSIDDSFYHLYFGFVSCLSLYARVAQTGVTKSSSRFVS